MIFGEEDSEVVAVGVSKNCYIDAFVLLETGRGLLVLETVNFCFKKTVVGHWKNVRKDYFVQKMRWL